MHNKLKHFIGNIIMKTLTNKDFTETYHYTDYKKQIKKETTQRQEARQQKRNWN